MKTYFNIKSNGTTETVDELDSKDFATMKDFRTERKRLTNEYRIAGIDIYLSQRCTKDWSN